jgi:ADP-ribose pyrophosphatase
MIQSHRIFAGRVVTLNVDQVRFPDGRVGEQEIVRHTGASVVLPFLSDPHGEDPQMLLIQQYRYATDGYLFELPAGRPNEGESPADCAARELREETGCVAEQMVPLIHAWSTPGFTDERLHFFAAYDITRQETEFDVDEYVEAVPMRMSRALAMIQSGEIEDMKTALGILYAAGFWCGV